jgi:predicted nucleic acid-binding protein
MRLIIDISIALPWNVASQATPLTAQAETYVRQEGAVVPFHFHLEFCNALVVLERRRRLKKAQVDEAIENISLLDLEIDDLAVRSISQTVLPLARLHELTLYDATYLELALRTGLPLATRDQALAVAAKKSGAALFSA